MEEATQKLLQLKLELKDIIYRVEQGKISAAEAADKITHIREEMDKVAERLKTVGK
jgi:hypothetical protein